jgi:hypothetical protein
VVPNLHSCPTLVARCHSQVESPLPLAVVVPDSLALLLSQVDVVVQMLLNRYRQCTECHQWVVVVLVVEASQVLLAFLVPSLAKFQPCAVETKALLQAAVAVRPQLAGECLASRTVVVQM